MVVFAKKKTLQKFSCNRVHFGHKNVEPFYINQTYHRWSTIHKLLMKTRQTDQRVIIEGFFPNALKSRIEVQIKC